MTIEIGIVNAKLPGNPGLSAYELAVKKGYVGTIEQWLLSLKGQQGLKGDIGLRGEKGDKGEDALSAYELAVEQGFIGSEEDWFNQFDDATIIESINLNLLSFNTLWNTRLITEDSSAYNQIRLPLISTGSYNFTVDWGDGTTDTITDWFSLDAIHTYTEPGIYTLKIEGEITGWQFNNTKDKAKLLTIEQWGPLKLGTTEGNYFYGCSELKIFAKDRLNLTNTTNLANCFKDCTQLVTNSQVSYWDVKNVNSMENMFENCINFNTDISTWYLDSVTNLSKFLLNAQSFSIENYTELLKTWSQNNLNGDIIMHVYSKYDSSAALARQNLVDNNNWTIIDGGVN